MKCPTIKIKANTGSFPYSVINESDFDPFKYELYTEETRPDNAENGVCIDGQGLDPIAEDHYPIKRGRK